MKLDFSKFFNNRKFQPILLIGIGVIALLVLFFAGWLTRGNSTIDAAQKAYQSGDIQKAMDILAVARDKNQINTAKEWNMLGNVYRDTKHIPEANEAYRNAIKADSGYETAYRNLSYLYVEWAEQDKNPQQKLQEIIGYIEYGRKSHPKSVTLVEDLIMLYGKTGDSAKVTELTALRTQLLE